jgi:hypothetical protein
MILIFQINQFKFNKKFSCNIDKRITYIKRKKNLIYK